MNAVGKLQIIVFQMGSNLELVPDDNPVSGLRA